MAWSGFPFLDVKKWYRYSPPRNDEPTISTIAVKKAATPKKRKKRPKSPTKRTSTKPGSNPASRAASPGTAQAKQPRAGGVQAENVAPQWPKSAQPLQAFPWIPVQAPDPAAVPERVDEQYPAYEWPAQQQGANQEPRFTVNQSAGVVVQEPDAAYLEVAWWPMQEQQRSYQKETLSQPDANEPKNYVRACMLVALFLLNASIVVSIIVLLLSDVVFSWTSALSTDATVTEETTYKVYIGSPPGRHRPHQEVNESDPRYTDPQHQTACVFHASADGLAIATDHVRFGISHFPFALCRLALFCCPSLASNLEPQHTDALMSKFASRARQVNRFAQPLMMLGDGSDASAEPFAALLSDLSGGSLARDVGGWYKARNYTGVVLRWPEATPATTWQYVAPLLRGLAQRLGSPKHPIRLGVALRQDSYGPDLKRIVSSLGKASIFLLPPAMRQNKYYAHTIRYFSQTTLDTLYSLNLRFLSRNVSGRLCYLFPADTYTYRVQPPDTTKSLGPGVQGPVTKNAGRIAYFETCKIASAYSKRFTDYGVEALHGDSFLAYTEPQLLGRFVDYMHEHASATCVGIWDPQMDDFGDACGFGEYPLTSATFRFYNDTHQ